MVILARWVGFALKTCRFCIFLGTIPRIIDLNRNTRCSCMEAEGCQWEDCQVWSGFVIGHQIKIGYFLTFKVLRTNVYKVTIFDYSVIKVVMKQ
jgi:hypothetical protein